MNLSKQTVFVALVVVALAVQKLVLPNLLNSAPPPAVAVAAQHPAKPLSPEVVRSRIVGNLNTLSYEYSEYLKQHPGRTITRDVLLRERGIPPDKIERVADETYPETFDPGVEIAARTPGGTVYFERTEVRFNGPPPPPEPDSDDAQTWTSQQLAAAPPDRLLTAFIFAAEHRQSLDHKQKLCSQISRAFNSFAPSADFHTRVLAFLDSELRPSGDRDMLFRVFIRRDPRSCRVLMRIAETAKSPMLRRAALDALGTPPRSLIDRLYPLVWPESTHPDVIRVLAQGIAQHCPYDDVDLLLHAALSTDPLDALHRDIAHEALQTITHPRGAEALVKRLQQYPPPDSRGEMLVRALSRVETRTATEAALAWIRQSDHDCSALITSLEPHPRHYQIKATWARAHDSGEAFRNELNRQAIRERLAPTRPAFPILNGSFETGTLAGFTTEGSVTVEDRWRCIFPTEGQHMLRLDTARNPLDGVSSVTSDPFVVPADTKTLLFEFNFAGSVLLNPVNEMIEAYLLTETDPVPIPDVRNLTILSSYEHISGHELGTGFHTVQVPVAAWAGTGEQLRLKFILHGRGTLPDRIPGTSRYDHNPMALGSNPGTALFLDNIRLSSRAVVPLPPIDARSFEGRRSGKTVYVKPVPAAFPENAAINIVDLAAQCHTLERTADGAYPTHVDEIENGGRWFHIGYSTPADEHGALYNQQILLFMSEAGSELAMKQRTVRPAGDR